MLSSYSKCTWEWSIRNQSKRRNYYCLLNLVESYRRSELFLAETACQNYCPLHCFVYYHHCSILLTVSLLCESWSLCRAERWLVLPISMWNSVHQNRYCNISQLNCLEHFQNNRAAVAKNEILNLTHCTAWNCTDN